MPGISLVVASVLDQQALSGALSDLKSDYSPLAEVLYKDDHFAIVFSGHEDYPKWFYEDEKNIVLFQTTATSRKMSGILCKVPMVIICVRYIQSPHHLFSCLMTVSDGYPRFIVKSQDFLRYPVK